MSHEAENQTFYDADAEAYDALRWDTPAGRFTATAQQDILAELCADWRSKTLVEIGPGTARFTIPLARQDNTVTLVDLAPRMLEVARRNIEREGLEERVAAYVHGSIYELPFEDASFDHAISLNVFNHLERPEQALKEMSRVLRPGGTLLFNFANLRSWYWPAARRINRRATAVGQDVYSRWEAPRRVRGAISDAGVELVQMLGHVHVPRAMEKYPLLPIVRLIDAASRHGPLRHVAAVQFCLCRKREEDA